jgi:hypothetical protein
MHRTPSRNVWFAFAAGCLLLTGCVRTELEVHLHVINGAGNRITVVTEAHATAAGGDVPTVPADAADALRVRLLTDVDHHPHFTWTAPRGATPPTEPFDLSITVYDLSENGTVLGTVVDVPITDGGAYEVTVFPDKSVEFGEGHEHRTIGSVVRSVQRQVQRALGR